MPLDQPREAPCIVTLDKTTSEGERCRPGPEVTGKPILKNARLGCTRVRLTRRYTLSNQKLPRLTIRNVSCTTTTHCRGFKGRSQSGVAASSAPRLKELATSATLQFPCTDIVRQIQNSEMGTRHRYFDKQHLCFTCNIRSSGRETRSKLTHSAEGLGIESACPPGFRTQLHVTTSLSTGGGPVSCVQLSEGGVQVVYHLGVWSRTSGLVQVLYGYG